MCLVIYLEVLLITKRLKSIYQENKVLSDLTNEYYKVFEELKNAEVKKKEKIY